MQVTVKGKIKGSPFTYGGAYGAGRLVDRISLRIASQVWMHWKSVPDSLYQVTSKYRDAPFFWIHIHRICAYAGGALADLNYA